MEQITDEQKQQLTKLQEYLVKKENDHTDFMVSKVILSYPFIEMCKLGRLLGFNRQFDDFHLLEEGGVHLLTCMVYDHKASKELDKHHRCKALLSVKGQEQPLEIMIDVLHSHWVNLPLAEEYEKVIKQIKNNSQHVTSYMLPSGQWLRWTKNVTY